MCFTKHTAGYKEEQTLVNFQRSKLHACAFSAQDNGELRLQRILLSLRGIADMLPNERSTQPWQSPSPQRQEEQSAASGFQAAVLRIFGSSNQVGPLA